ncbi:hypothetical protein [Roseiconus lacunae]|uniref:Apea-like HEPN domain-containing protein n=1 Tax=Roseiconus lacunae TaxID=2605694 RepID=A0ABT7PDW7_9BACT|nr:hypothetical protein [Roseiconus lacunae]MDM4014676.1 hypothetical protein [Roseiconus lacunae]
MIPLTYLEFAGRNTAELPHNEATVLDTLQAFAEIEEGDPRLMVIVAGARIESAIDEAIQTYGPESQKLPSKFHTRMSRVRDLGIVEPEFARYVTSVRRLRNFIAHRPTRDSCLSGHECFPLIRKAFDYSASVPVWHDSVDPDTDLRRSVFALCVAGVMASEIDIFDPLGALVPKGFTALREWASSPLSSG